MSGKRLDEAWQRASYNFFRADEKALEAVRAALTPGRRVYWRHGRRRRTGVVIEILGHMYVHAQCRISTDTNKQVDIGVARILEEVDR